MKLVYEVVHEGTHVQVYHKKPKYSLVVDLIEAIITRVITNPIIRHFREINIIIKLEDEFKGGINDGLGAVWDSKLGYVRKNEIEAGHNVVWINEGVMISSFYHGLGISETPIFNSNAEKKAFEKKRDDSLLDKMVQTLIHEITHLWQLRINETSELVNKNKKRINETFFNLIRSGKEFIMEDFDIIKVWRHIRVELLMLIDGIVAEGIANYVSFLHVGKLTFSKESLLSYHEFVALKSADDLKLKLDNLFEDIGNYLTKAKGIRFCGNCGSKYMVDYQHKDDEVRCRTCGSVVYVIHPKDRINPAQKFKNIIDGAHDYSYEIGPHIYQTILVMFEDVTLEDLAKYNYRKILHLYEKAAHMAGFIPVFSLSGGHALINYN